MANPFDDLARMVPRPQDLYPTRPPVPELQLRDFPKNPLIENVEANHASEFNRRLVDWITHFDNNLDNEHEVGVRLVSFGQTVIFHLEDLGYWNPSLISFSGTTDAGEPVELIQHVSQISILLMKLKRKDTSQPKRRIGFRTEPDAVER